MFIERKYLLVSNNGSISGDCPLETNDMSNDEAADCQTAFYYYYYYYCVPLLTPSERGRESKIKRQLKLFSKKSKCEMDVGKRPSFQHCYVSVWNLVRVPVRIQLEPFIDPR